MSNTLLTILIVISISFLNFNYCKESLRFAFALTRNGVRSPLILDENKKDIFGEEWLGRGELTKIGKRQQLLLGYHFYLRYVENLSLLSKVYDPREVYFSSTETNYTLQSSYAQVHGLYLQGVPLVNDAQKNNAIPPNIQPMYLPEKELLENNALPNNMMIAPVHTFYEKDHTIELHKIQNCKNLGKYYENKQKSKEVTDIMNDIVDQFGNGLLKIINKQGKGDITIENLKTNLTLFEIIIDTFISEFSMGGRMRDKFPFNHQKLYDKAMEFINIYSIGGFNFKKYEDENIINEERQLSCISISPTMEKILNWMDTKINNDMMKKYDIKSYSSPKFVDYILHSSSLSVFHLFMAENFSFEKKFKQISFSSSLLLELYRNDTDLPNLGKNSFMVKYIFDNEELLNIPYEEFYNKIKNILKSEKELHNYCGFEKEGFDFYILYTIGLTILISSMSVYIIHYKRNKRTNPISSLNQNKALK